MQSLYKGIFKDKKVLVTGHTGFKGSWLCLILNELGAKVYGYALEPPTKPSLFREAGIEQITSESIMGDIRSYDYLLRKMKDIQPEIVFHLAAQPLVRESYKNPIETYSTNVMGTVHLLEACRHTPAIKALLNVTTDKCYENKEWIWAYRENEPMGGYDPYSNSKGCSELVTSSFRSSFFNPADYEHHRIAIATARAGNVIGGGDWAEDRLIPDFIRSIASGKNVQIRNPLAIRPWQHVLECVHGYLLLVSGLLTNGAEFSGAWNFGPLDTDSKNVEEVIKILCSVWGDGASYSIDTTQHPHEASWLKLDSTKARIKLGWSSKWNLDKALKVIVEWNKAYYSGKNIREVCINQITEYYQKS